MIHEFNLKMRGPDGLPTGHTGIPKGSSAQTAVNKILAAANGNPIRVLRLLAHGDAGEFDFPGIEDYSSVSSKYLQLRKAFSPLGRIDLHGCGCASEKKMHKTRDPRTGFEVEIGQYTADPKGQGLRFLYAVARTFNVPTTGAIDSQIGADGWSYRGTTVTISPGGKFYALKEGQRQEGVLSSAHLDSQREFQRIARDYISKKLFAQARTALRVLIATYPASEAAGWARELLPAGALENPPRGLETKFD